MSDGSLGFSAARPHEALSELSKMRGEERERDNDHVTHTHTRGRGGGGGGGALRLKLKEQQIMVLHDFCFGYPYGFVLVLGGLMGYLMKGSTMSLAMGGATGTVVLLCAHLSHATFVRSGKRAIAATSVAMITAMATAVAMAKRFADTGSIFPAAVVGITR